MDSKITKKLVYNVNQETWNKIHSEAVSSGLSIGKFIEKIFEFYMKNNAVNN